jgi:DNA-binding transcriptional LysR family regulator
MLCKLKEEIIMLSLGIETFLTVIREKSITSAAAKLHVAQSTISQRLQMLERETGMTLIDRGKGVKHVRLTPSGEEFLKLAEQWHLLEQQSLILKAHGPKLVLSIGAVDSINTYLLLDAFRALSKHNPPVQLIIKSIHSWDQYSAMEHRQIDIGFSLQQMLSPNVNVTKVFSSPMVVLFPATSKNERIKTIHPSELDPSHEVSVLWGPEFKLWHDQWWHHQSPSHITSYYANMALAILNSPQWLILPLHIANSFLTRGNCDNYCIYQLTDLPPEYECYRLTHKRPTPLTRQAISIFENYLDSSLIKHQCNLLETSCLHPRDTQNEQG